MDSTITAPPRSATLEELQEFVDKYRAEMKAHTLSPGDKKVYQAVNLRLRQRKHYNKKVTDAVTGVAARLEFVKKAAVSFILSLFLYSLY